ncbi:MAG TPA: SDR family NAD(P)-dependent oxidoreductase [Pseudolabrys sp.]|nr:SDR family NAD(P)-dependent oxidoreductase [Pseudolabrys sp.]
MQAVLVSGGSGGIGAAACRRLAAAGYRPLVGYARNKDAAETVARATGGAELALDLADVASIDGALGALKDAPLVGVVLAGSPPPRVAPLAQVDGDELALAWQVNVAGPQRLLARLVRDVFRKNRRGIVVGVLSEAMGLADGKAMSGMGAYTIAKYGLAGLLAVIEADYPWLTVRRVSPGFTETAMLSAFDPRFLEIARSRVPFQQPDDVAEEIVRVFVQARPGTEQRT